MSTWGRKYGYVGPVELEALVRPGRAGWKVGSSADFDAWASARTAEELAEPFAFVVDSAGTLRLAPRRSEHVVCAGGESVLGAGEMSFGMQSGRWAVEEVSNQSTGYCPDVRSWPAVADALDRAGIARPPGFTHEVVFRLCPAEEKAFTKPVPKGVGARISFLLGRAKGSTRAVAKRLGVSQRTVQRYRAGTVKAPRGDVQERMEKEVNKSCPLRP